ncbi:hypothetical protein AB0M54_24550 [Actinoplanes sp. NPDC051470]|uniref:hypothetical protein n=1 Tax=Actinoplanes sp. NPDC051470 TaxID=3157224 RepID=UPI0034422761
MTTVTQTQEHRHVGGSVGGKGDNDAECACGTTFSGFDTHAQAMRALDAHIADEARTLDPWAVLAAELTNIATDLAALAGSGLPIASVTLYMQPGNGEDDELTVRTVDAMGQMLFDRDGEPRKMGNNRTHYDVSGMRGRIDVSAFNSVSTEWVERQKHVDELAELKARVAAAEADAKRLRDQLAAAQGPKVFTAVDPAPYAQQKQLIEWQARYARSGHPASPDLIAAAIAADEADAYAEDEDRDGIGVFSADASQHDRTP